MENLEQILNEFEITNVTQIVPFGAGLINRTYKVGTENLGSFLLQKLNSVALPNIDKVLQNIEAVGNYLKSINEKCLFLRKTKSGQNSIKDADGFVYRVYPFIENSVSYDFSRDENIIFQVAYGFGRFDRLVRGIEDGKVVVSDEHFHDTLYKYEHFKNAVKSDRCGRVSEIQNEILEADNIIRYAKQKGIDIFQISKLRDSRKLKTQVVHNDTKLNNCLLDENNKYLCVVDLDTCMPGLVINDFADGIRYIANLATEDEENLDKVGVNFASYKAFTSGFFKGLNYEIDELERQLLSTSPIAIAFELGCRFLEDYINGDVFFKVDLLRPNLNLIRARVQFRYCKALIDNLPKEKEIIEKVFSDKGNC